ISFNNNMDNSTFVAETRQYANTCGSDFYVAEADVSFLPNALGLWYYVNPDSANISANTPTAQNDFFSVALHEFGHASLIKHVNDQSDLMYYTVFPGHLRGDISPNDQAGGVNCVTYSKTKNYNPGCFYAPINIPSNGSGSCLSPTSGIEKINANTTLELSVYPNPASNLLNITFKKQAESSNTVK